MYQIIKNSLKIALQVAWKLIKVYIPLSILSTLLKEVGFFEWISPYISPFMKYLGLPGNASITIIATFFGNIYAGIATIPVLNLSAREITILGIILGLSHNLFVETGILINLNFATIRIAFFRIFVALITGLILNLLLPQNISGEVLNPFLKTTTTTDWFKIIMGMLTTILQIIIIIFLLQFIYEYLKKWTFSRTIKPYLNKFGNIWGLSSGAVIPWLTGFIFGIVYGSGIMYQFIQNKSILPKDISIITIFLVFAHAIIEDSLLFAIVGGNFWIIFTIRTLLAFTLILFLSKKDYYKLGYVVGVKKIIE